MKRIIVCLGLLLSLMPLLVAQPETKKIAILEVVDRDNTINYGVRLLLRTTLAKAITQTPGYEGYDRVDMGAIQGEQDFQRTGMVSDEQIKRLGEMTGAAYVLVAEAAKIDANNMIVTAKILDVETAKLERTDYEQMGMDAKEMAEGCRAMASRLLTVSNREVMGANTNNEIRSRDGFQKREQEYAVSQELDTLILEPGSKVIRKGAFLFVEDQNMIRTRMSDRQEHLYLGDYYSRWKKKRTQWIAGVTTMAAGGGVFLIGTSYLIRIASYYGRLSYQYGYYTDDGEFINKGTRLFAGAKTNLMIMALGAAIEIAGVFLYIGPNKQMNRILQTVNEQHGIAPYRTEVSFNLGNQPHGIGLGLRF